ncbi:MAG: PfkB family carbohydrate kinase [Pyrinomonadaceae bacterium]
MLWIKPKKDCAWDVVSLGEVMLRFDPGEERIHSARSFRVWEGGGEYNVARNLSKCFQLDTAVVTALADNQIGRLVEDLIAQGGVDLSQILWRPTDGISRVTRNGIYFMERGFGSRAPLGCSDRGNTAVSQLKPSEIDWKSIFSERGSRWFHTGGIFAGLSESTAETALEAMKAAKENATIVSYDLNYRDSIWAGRGGRDAANEVNRRLLEYADVVFGVEGFDAALSHYAESELKRASTAMFKRHSDLKIAATTLRDVESASRHNLSGVCISDGKISKAKDFNDVAVLDRVGSGDAFAAGIIYGLLTETGLQSTIDLAVSSAVLSLASGGDGSSATLGEIERLARSSDSTAIR